MTNQNIDTLTRTWTCVLFDLDGTLTDSAPGITASLAETFTRLGRPVPSEDELMAYVGPPLLDSFRNFAGMSEIEALDSLGMYRLVSQERDLIGNAVFPGIAGLLASIHKEGIPLAVATSKPESRAVAILEHFDLAKYFTVISGASEDESRSSKADVMADALRRLGEDGVDLERTVMIGDRAYDVEGATENNVPAVLVEWGYGSPVEAAGTLAVVHSIDQLRKFLIG